MGSATPNINKGCPPNIECMIPHMAVEVKVSTVLKFPSTEKKKNKKKKKISEPSVESRYPKSPTT